MDRAKIEQKRLALQKKLTENDDATKKSVEAAKAEGAEKRASIQSELDTLEAVVRSEERAVKGKMAFALGDFLLRNGVSDASVQKIVKSKEFGEHVRGKKAREIFGLPPLPAAPKPATQ